MDLAAFRKAQAWTLADLARRLGIEGANPARSAQRIETGEAQPDADMIAHIERLSSGAVTASDMLTTRLAFLERTGRARDFHLEAAP